MYGVLVNFSSENCGRWLNGWERGTWQARDGYEMQYTVHEMELDARASIGGGTGGGCVPPPLFRVGGQHRNCPPPLFSSEKLRGI